VVYEEVLDGLDPRSIYLAKITKDGIEEAVGTYSPLERASSLVITSIPEGWNKLEAEGILKQVLGQGQEEEVVVSTNKDQEIVVPPTTPAPTTPAPTTPAPTNVPRITSEVIEKPNTVKPPKKETPRSMEW
jgi:hypothetical protein